MPIRFQRSYRFREPALPTSQLISDFSGGLNTRDSILDLGKNELSKAQNIRLGLQGGLKKRKGMMRVGQKIGSTTKVLGVHSYVNKANTAYLLATYDTDIYKYSESNSVTTIATSSASRATGYTKDRHVFVTTDNLDANSDPYIAVIYQNGAGIKLEWEDRPYGTWTNTVIDVDVSTQLGFSGYMDSSDNIHIAFMSDGNTVKYIKMTYGAGPTWTAGTASTVKGSGASDSASRPTIFVESGGRIHIAYRYYDGTNYQVRAIYSDDGTTWLNESNLSTASTNTRHFPAFTHSGDKPILVYQVGGASSTSYFWRSFEAEWSSQATALTATTNATDAEFSCAYTGSALHVISEDSTSSTGVSISVFGTLANTDRRQFSVVNDGANDNDIQYKKVLNNSADSTTTRVSNDSSNNLYPTSPEQVAASADFVPVMWVEGTANPYNIKINLYNRWVALSASLTTNLPMVSTYFPNTAAGGTDMIYLTNGTDTAKKWDGTTLTAANASWPKPKWIVHYENRLWMGNYGTTQNRVAYTTNGADQFGGALTSTNTLDLPEQSVWGHVLGRSILLFTRANIYKVTDYDYTGSNVGPEKVRTLQNSKGTLSGRTVVQIGEWVYYQAPDGHVYRTSGEFSQLVTGKISGTIAELSTATFLNAAATAFGYYYILAVGLNGSTQNNSWIVIDTRNLSITIDTGKNTGCFVVHPDSNGVPQLFCGDSSTSNGTVYQAEIGESDAGSAIEMDVRTGLLAFGNPLYRKFLSRGVAYAKASGDYNLTIGYSGYSNVNSFTQQPVDLGTDSSVWGVGTWGTGVWGGNTNVQKELRFEKYDRLFMFQFYNNGANQPVEANALSINFEIIKDVI